MKNLSQMVLKLVLALLLVALPSSYSEAKPNKITKLIYFDGSVDKKKPIGHGKLILDRCVKNENANYHIEGDFSDDKITNAVFYINGEQTKGIINGDFGYAIDEKESTVTLTLNNVTFSCSYIINGKDKYYRHNDDLEHLFLGTVVIGKDRGSNGKGMGFIQDYYLSNRVDLPFDEYPKVLNPLISSPQCTREGLVYVKCEKGNGFFYVENTQFKSNNFKFKNGATYIPTDDESGVLEKPGSDVLQVKLFDKLILLKKNSVIQLKDKSTLKITDMKIPNDFDKNTKRGKWDVEVDGEITFTDGSKYNGTLLLSQLSCGQDGWGMTVYNYFKNIASKDLFLFYGKLVSSQGTVTEYIQNKTRDEFKAQLVAKGIIANQDVQEDLNKDHAYSVTIDQYGRVKFNHRTSDGTETMSGLYDIKKLSEADLSIMRKDEYVVAIDDLSSSAANIEFKGYDSNRGCLIFYSNDLRGFTRNINDKIYHFNACYDLRLSYPKSLVEIESYTDISGDKMYEQTLYSCKVDRNTAAEFQTSNVRLLVHFKFDRIKDDQIFGNATKMTLINLSTGASVDLTPSLKASNAAFKKVTNGYKPSSKKYHPEGRTVECWNCQGRGWNTRTGSSAHITCNICGGKGWKIEHEW